MSSSLLEPLFLPSKLASSFLPLPPVPICNPCLVQTGNHPLETASMHLHNCIHVCTHIYCMCPAADVQGMYHCRCWVTCATAGVQGVCAIAGVGGMCATAGVQGTRHCRCDTCASLQACEVCVPLQWHICNYRCARDVY